MKKTAIIGGGAAGMMAAASMIEHHSDHEIHLFEKNPSLGAKVIISGGGRCNVTTGITDRDLLLSKYIRGADFLQYVFTQLPPEKVIAWFESHGVRLKNEKDLRVFPVSDNGKDVVGAFEKLFKKSNVILHLGESVKSILPTQGNRFEMVSNKGTYEVDAVIITTGGNAYSHTGSTGDGYDFAKSCGHSITALGPSLNSFLCVEEWPKDLSGVSLEKARLESRNELGKKVAADGPLLFTHFGISGPVTFALSSFLAFTKISKESPHKIAFIPIAGRKALEWDTLIKSTIADQGARQIGTVLASFLPQRLAAKILDIAHIDSKRKSAEISKADRQEIVQLLTGKMELTLIQRRPGDEFVTAGGVALGEVDDQTMRSRLNPHLYFAGEVLDIDGLTGGFNLQSSWATGWLAGKSVVGQNNKHCA